VQANTCVAMPRNCLVVSFTTSLDGINRIISEEVLVSEQSQGRRRSIRVPNRKLQLFAWQMTHGQGSVKMTGFLQGHLSQPCSFATKGTVIAP